MLIYQKGYFNVISMLQYVDWFVSLFFRHVKKRLKGLWRLSRTRMLLLLLFYPVMSYTLLLKSVNCHTMCSDLTACIPKVLALNDDLHSPFDISEFSYNVLEPYCLHSQSPGLKWCVIHCARTLVLAFTSRKWFLCTLSEISELPYNALGYYFLYSQSLE